MLFLAGDFKRSLADCDQVMKRNPHHFGALAGYGQIYFQLKQYEKAIEYYERARTGLGDTFIQDVERVLAVSALTSRSTTLSGTTSWS